MRSVSIYTISLPYLLACNDAESDFPGATETAPPASILASISSASVAASIASVSAQSVASVESASVSASRNGGDSNGPNNGSLQGGDDGGDSFPKWVSRATMRSSDGKHPLISDVCAQAIALIVVLGVLFLLFLCAFILLLLRRRRRRERDTASLNSGTTEAGTTTQTHGGGEKVKDFAVMGGRKGEQLDTIGSGGTGQKSEYATATGGSGERSLSPKTAMVATMAAGGAGAAAAGVDRHRSVSSGGGSGGDSGSLHSQGPISAGEAEGLATAFREAMRKAGDE